MSALLESAEQQARLMPRRWGDLDAPVVIGFSDGLSAALLNPRPGEIASPPSDAHILSLVTRGERRHTTWRDGRLALDDHLPDGSINIVPAGSAPRAVVREPICVLHLYLTRDRLALDAERAGAGDKARSLELIDPFSVRDGRRERDVTLISLLAAFKDAIAPSTWQHRLLLDGLGSAICARVIQRWSNLADGSTPLESEPQPLPRDWRIRRTLEQLEARLGEDIGLTDLAIEVGLSATHFTALFRSGTGLPLHRWVMKRRVERACAMLADPRQTVTEIAHALGFASSQHLATVFKKHTGVTPTAYRNARLS